MVIVYQSIVYMQVYQFKWDFKFFKCWGGVRAQDLIHMRRLHKLQWDFFWHKIYNLIRKTVTECVSLMSASYISTVPLSNNCIKTRLMIISESNRGSVSMADRVIPFKHVYINHKIVLLS